MKAIVIEKTGGREVLMIKDITEPATPKGSVKIKVKAFGLNRAEMFFRMGSYGKLSVPRVPGIDAVGEIIEDGTATFKKGQKVITMMGGMMMARDGSYAEYVTAPVNNVYAVNVEISWEELATLPQAYGTVWVALDHSLKIKAGETLLVRGASSSVGLAAMAYAKSKGLTVIATTRNKANIHRLKSFGADYVVIDNGIISEKVKEIYPQGVDKALEIVGGTTVKDTILAIKPYGEITVIGLLGGSLTIENLHMMAELGDGVKLSFSKSGHLGTELIPLDKAPFNGIAKDIINGRWPSLLTKTFQFGQIKEAHKLMEQNEAVGKIVVIV